MVKEGLYSDLIEPRHHITSIGISPNRRGASSMKKYYQAALLTVALLSLVSLLFYRHEYNRLRYVLGVLNFYGTPGAKGADPNYLRDNFNPEKINLLFDSPLPSWQRLNDDLFVYSAHHVSTGEIRAIAFGRARDSLDMNCKVFFEGKAPHPGSFKHMKIEQTSEYAGYQLICEYAGIAIPESVAFFSGESNEAQILIVKNSPDNLVTNEISLCVVPPMNRSISRTDMISFLAFHQIIDIRHFVIYDNAIPSRFTETVRDIVISNNLNMTFTILPWNFPFVGVPNDVIKGIIEIDCLYRSHNEVEYSVALYWEEYLVLKYHHGLLDLLKDLEKTMPDSERYSIHTSVFCTEQKDEKKTMDVAPMVFKKTSRLSSSESVKTRNVYISKPHKCLNFGNRDAIKADGDLINVNHYRYCEDPDTKFSYTYDGVILKFANDVFDAFIYKEYITRQALSNK